jgi:tRNA-2-methylthio-N6-dimethylallyladenosine synthase
MRVAQLVDTQRRITLELNRRYIGTAMEVLVEGDATRSSTQGMGKTDGNVTVVWNKETGHSGPGTLMTKRIFDASAATLYGE